MNIVYLKELQSNPSLEINQSGHFSTISGITEIEISQLEQLYNNGTPFPKVLKELLYLAGNECYVLDYGRANDQQELQEIARKQMQDNDILENRPFYVFDFYSGYSFLFIYLDEGDNPDVYQGTPYSDENWKKKINHNIQSLINNRITRVKEGTNPF